MNKNEKAKFEAELLIIKDEKAKLEAELLIAKDEKAMRAAELLIANKELHYQNKEKEKRADELLIANKELRYQNKEKEKHATELDIAIKKHIQTEIVLKQSEKRYRRLFESAKDGIIIIDSETGKINDVNPHLIEMLGYSKEMFIEKAIWEIGSFKDNIDNREKFMQLQTKGYIRYEDMLLQTADGHKIQVEFVSNVYSSDGKNVIQCNIRDVTERKKSEETIIQLASFPSLHPDPIIELELDGNLKYSNPAAKNLFPDLELLGTGHPFLTNLQAFTTQLSAEENDTLEREIMVGGCYYLQSLQHIKLLKVFRIYSHNITERKKAELDLKESEKKYSSYIENAPDGVFISDNKGQYIEVNKAAVNITGYSKNEILQMTIGNLLTKEFMQTGLNHFKRLVENGFSDELMQFKHKDGSKRWLDVSAVKLNDNRFLSFVKDITDKKRMEDELAHQNFHDSLTGIYNRRFFEEELKRLDTQRNFPISIIMGDINGLKLFNDSFGHTIGDNILKTVAELISKECRSDDILARLGGDEFVVVLPKTDAITATRIINRIEKTVSKEKCSGIKISVSFGHDTKEKSEQKISDILVNAENHMYRHKIFEHSSMRSETIDVIMSTLFEKSNRELMHSKRVSKICELIANNMKLVKDDVKQIKSAGLVHDIGKIGLAELILNKTERLNDTEWDEIKKHPEAGWRILSSAKEFSEIAQFILEHHEKWDGTGYPKGLKGKKISIEARIITLADSYDAMTSVRSYKNKLSKDEAIAEIKRCSGTQFDPELVDLFVNKVALSLHKIM